MTSSPRTLGELAERLGCELRGEPARTLERIAAIDTAGPDELSFVVGPAWRERLAASRAGAVIVPPDLAAEAPGDCLVAADPYASYAQASWLFSPEPAPSGEVHPSATIHPGAYVAPSASVGAGVVVEEGVRIEEGAVIGALSVIGPGARVGARTRLFPRVALGEGVTLGRDCRVQSGAVIGGEGFGYARTSSGWHAIRQSGGVEVGERVHVGANTTIDRGAIGPTRIDDGVILDNQIQIAHNVRIGENTAIAGCTGIAGSARIGRDCMIGGACNIAGHIEIVDNVVLNATSFVTRSIERPGRYGGSPLLPEIRWRRSFALLGRLEEIAKRLRRLERDVGAGRAKASDGRTPERGAADADDGRATARAGATKRTGTREGDD